MKKIPRWAFWTLCGLAAMALLRDVLANDCPLACRVGGEVFFPAFRAAVSSHERAQWPPQLAPIARESAWQRADYEWVVFPVVPFRPGSTSADTTAKPPFSTQKFGARTLMHWLGTTRSGHDVAAGIVAGARVALLTGFAAMGMALGIGLPLGLLAGYFADDRLRVRRGMFWANLLGLPTALVFAFVPRWTLLTQTPGTDEWGSVAATFGFILLIFNLLGWLLCRVGWGEKRLLLPADLAIMRLAEVFESVPMLMVVVALLALSPTGTVSLWLMVGAIGAFSWPSAARLLRAEMLRVREMEFMQAARALGLPDWQVLWRHALPNAMRPVLLAASLGTGGAVLLEASLAFLGITHSAAGASWGNLLNASRGHLDLWWVAVFPGLALCWTLLALAALRDEV